MADHFSRSGMSNPFGKNTEEVKSSIPLEAKEALTGLAVLNGQSTAEYVRDIIFHHLYGHMTMIRAYQQRSSIATARIGRENGEGETE